MDDLGAVAIALVWLAACITSLRIFWPHYEGYWRKTFLIMWSLGGGPFSLGLLWLVHWSDRQVETLRDDEGEDEPIPGGASPRKCSNCGTAYSLTDYKVDAPMWSCSQCHATLPRQQP